MKIGYGLQSRWRTVKHEDEWNEWEDRVFDGFELHGEWPATVSDREVRVTTNARSAKVGTLLSLPPYRVRVIDYDPSNRALLVVPARPGWQFLVLRLAASRRWQTFKYRVRATLSIWGIGHWPRNSQ